MASHLTRLVFRSIIANEPLLYRECRLRATQPRITTHHVARLLHPVQQRTFLNMLKPRRKLKPKQIPAGLEKMSELAYAQHNALRPPKPEEIVAALAEFFAQRRGPFEDFHANLAHNAFKYLLENPRADGQPWLSRKELTENVFVRITQSSIQLKTDGKAHLDFGQTVLSALANMTEPVGEEAQGEPTKQKSELWTPEVDLKIKTVQLLSLHGSAIQARDMVVQILQDNRTGAPLPPTALLRMWDAAIEGLIREGNSEELRKTTELMQAMSIPLTKSLQDKLILFFCAQQDLDRAKLWYHQPVVTETSEEGEQPNNQATSMLLKTAALKGDLSFGQEAVATILKDNMPKKEDWDAILVWSAAAGKGVDEVDRMINVLLRRNEEERKKNSSIPQIRPDVDTINALVELCISKRDPYSAERYITLGEKLGILPDEKTYTMQIQYRLSVGDLDGARAAYANLEDIFSNQKDSVMVVNELIQALCKARILYFDELMAMVDNLHEHKAYFAPETVAALILLHLKRGEIQDAQDLLQVHAHQYSPKQRITIQKSLIAFILDGETSTADAWDGYQILRNVFADTPRADRMTIMNEFFARKRSDMACHVFFHMRNHVSDPYRADHGVYLAAFTGFARCADAESLELAHNQLRIDLNVDLDTKLRNSLMLAYAAVGDHSKAFQFWTEICESKEGPSYNSIAIVFRSCEGAHFGGERAKSIFRRLKDQDVEIDKHIWTAYMCAIARNWLHQEALALIESVEEDYGFKPDLQMYVWTPVLTKPYSFNLIY